MIIRLHSITLYSITLQCITHKKKTHRTDCTYQAHSTQEQEEHMKRTVKILCSVALAIALALTGLPIQKASAEYKSFPGEGQAANLEVQMVEYIENYLYPRVSDKNLYYMFSEQHGVGSFSVDKPSVVKAYYTWDTTNKAVRVTGTSWFSWDIYGRDVLGTKWNLSAPASSSYVFVDPGTYYINQQFSITNSNTPSGEYIGITLLIEPITTTETVYETWSPENPNIIDVNTDQYGFLSTNSQHDFYRFTISEYGKVDITFYFYAKGGNKVSQGVCALFNEKDQRLGTYEQKFNTTDYSRNTMTAYLDEGTYIVEMSGCTAPTYLKVGYTSYGITITGATTETRSEDAHITVSTGIDAAEVLVVDKAVSDADKANTSIWNTAVNITSTMKYDASSNGDYTVRVKDKTGQYYLKSFTIKGIDKQAPTITADEVESGDTVEADEKMVIITDDGEITKITLNGSKIDLEEYYDTGLQAYVLNLTEKRKYTIKAYDKTGKTTKFVFTLK